MNRPINQVILGGDSLFNPMDDLDVQIQNIENYKQKLQQLKSVQNQNPTKFIWDDIDSEIKPLTDEQKSKLFENYEYTDVYMRIQTMVQNELLNLVKGKIESSTEGHDLLTEQLKLVRKLKAEIVNETNREMELFKQFKEFSKNNPEATYDNFIKSNM